MWGGGGGYGEERNTGNKYKYLKAKKALRHQQFKLNTDVK